MYNLFSLIIIQISFGKPSFKRFSERRLFSEPLFRDCAIERVYKSRDEVFARGTERSVRLFTLKEENNWTEDEFGIALQ